MFFHLNGMLRFLGSLSSPGKTLFPDVSRGNLRRERSHVLSEQAMVGQVSGDKVMRKVLAAFILKSLCPQLFDCI
jgi:hypothetical protein